MTISNIKYPLQGKQISKIKTSKKGFTLIELLVVISILGLLAGLVISNMAGVRERARDAERKSDLKEIQNALEMYKHDQLVPQYPTNAQWSLKILKTGNYMKTVPNDPKCPIGICPPGWLDYQYTRNSTDSLKYTIIVCLENASDSQRDISSVGGCTTSFSRSEP